MGYRTYIAIIDKKQLNSLRKCNTLEDVAKVFEKYGWEYEKDEEGYYCPVYNVGYTAVHEFGKYYENNYDEFNKKQKRIFKNKELDAEYEEYDFQYGGQELLEFAIQDYHSRIKRWFENLSSPKTCLPEYETWNKTEDELKEMHYQKLVNECKAKTYEWNKSFGLSPYNMNKKTQCCVSSWLYEYEIFDLVRMYKLFDSKKHYVVYYGW